MIDPSEFTFSCNRVELIGRMELISSFISHYHPKAIEGIISMNVHLIPDDDLVCFFVSAYSGSLSVAIPAKVNGARLKTGKRSLGDSVAVRTVSYYEMNALRKFLVVGGRGSETVEINVREHSADAFCKFPDKTYSFKVITTTSPYIVMKVIPVPYRSHIYVKRKLLEKSLSTLGNSVTSVTVIAKDGKLVISGRVTGNRVTSTVCEASTSGATKFVIAADFLMEIIQAMQSEYIEVRTSADAELVPHPVSETLVFIDESRLVEIIMI
jgi:hypothetical protein